MLFISNRLRRVAYRPGFDEITYSYGMVHVTYTNWYEAPLMDLPTLFEPLNPPLDIILN